MADGMEELTDYYLWSRTVVMAVAVGLLDCGGGYRGVGKEGRRGEKGPFDTILVFFVCYWWEWRRCYYR